MLFISINSPSTSLYTQIGVVSLVTLLTLFNKYFSNKVNYLLNTKTNLLFLLVANFVSKCFNKDLESTLK